MTTGATGRSVPELDALLEEILTDAHGEDEQLWAFRQVIEDEVELPADAFVLGEPVALLEVDYDGNKRRGLTARCRREDGAYHIVSFADVRFAPGSSAARYAAAYRKWLGVEAVDEAPGPPRKQRRHKVSGDDLDLGAPVDLVVLSVKQSAARCRLLGAEHVVTLRTYAANDLVPGEIVTIRPAKQWRYAGHPYLSGEVEGTRLDVAALGLVPLRLEDRGIWDPREEEWTAKSTPLEAWEKAIMARGPRPAYEMEQVLPGVDPADWDADPILEAVDLKEAGDRHGARRLLMSLAEADPRCLDAHAHLGNLEFDHRPDLALRHYLLGVRVGELSLGPSFAGVLAWGYTDNRPFLRCMQGHGLCLWRLGHLQEAICVFERMLWMSPTDSQGIRFLLPALSAGEPWDAHERT